MNSVLIKNLTFSRLLRLLFVLQLITISLVRLFWFVGKQQKWGNNDFAGLDIKASILFFTFMYVSAVLRYGFNFLLASLPKGRDRGLPFICGASLNAIVDVWLVYFVIKVIAVPQVDGGFALLLLPVSWLGIFVVSSVVVLVVKFMPSLKK